MRGEYGVVEQVASGLEGEAALAAETLSEVFVDHEAAQLEDWVRRASREPAEWQDAAGISGRTLHLTPAELVELRERVEELTAAFADRRDDPAARPPGARPVRMLISAWLPRAGGGS